LHGFFDSIAIPVFEHLDKIPMFRHIIFSADFVVDIFPPVDQLEKLKFIP